MDRVAHERAREPIPPRSAPRSKRTIRRMIAEHSTLLKIVLLLSVVGALGLDLAFVVMGDMSEFLTMLSSASLKDVLLGILTVLVFTLVGFLQAFWFVSGFAGVFLIFKKGYWLEAIGCAILAGGIPLLLPIMFGTIFLIIGMLLPDKAKHSRSGVRTLQTEGARTQASPGAPSKPEDAQGCGTRSTHPQEDERRTIDRPEFETKGFNTGNEQAMQTVSYYRVLQVDRQAEQEVIEAAYRRLMRKYHPDVLDPDQRDDPEIQRKAKEINVAYSVLSDPQQRSQYDSRIRREEEKRQTKEDPVERAVCQVRCSKTKQQYRMFLARLKEGRGVFQVVGFEALGKLNQQGEAPAQVGRQIKPRTTSGLLPNDRLSTPGKPAPQETRVRNDRAAGTDFSVNFASGEQFEAMHDGSGSLDLGDVDWNNSACPGCGSEYVHSSGLRIYWFRCEKCGHLFCAANARKNLFGIPSMTCVWCGHNNYGIRLVQTGQQSRLRVEASSMQNQLGGGPSRQQLPDAGRRKRLGPPSTMD